MNRKKELIFFNNNNSFEPPPKRNKFKYDSIKLIPQKIARPIRNISDSDGLKIAYSRPNGIYNYGNTLYIAGTKSFNDAWDDLKIPFNATQYSQRYQDAKKYVSHPSSDITHVVGHSLGGAVSLELEKNYPNIKSTTYAAPTISTPWEAQNTRYRNPADVISIFDRGATNVGDKMTLDPFENHSYANFDNKSGDTGNWLIGDTTKNTPWNPANSAFTTPPIEQKDLINLKE